MKTNKILTLVAGGCLLLGGLSSCEDFLTLYPTNSITEEEFWEDKGDLENAMMACYKQMTNGDLVSKVLLWGEARSDNAVLKNMSNASFVNYKDAILEYTEGMFSWAPFYTAINYCNKVIEYTPLVAERDLSLSEGEQMQYITEAKTLRALNYFYLVRAFRDVPLVMQSISTDAEAMNSQLPQTPGLNVLDSLIADLDTIKDLGVRRHGTAAENCGRVTRNATYTLLADMYLWRACMLKDAEAKGYTFNPSSCSNTEATAAAQSTADLNKAVEYCDVVIQAMRDEYNEEHNNSFGSNQNQTEQESRYPLIRISNNYTRTDEIFNDIFGSKNSSEGILEIQYDGTNNVNGTWYSYLTSNTTTGLVGQYFTINSKMYGSVSSSADPTGGVGFGKGDLRALWSGEITPTTSQIEYLYTKGSRSNITLNTMSDVSQGVATSTDRPNASNAANWIIYRLSDVMLIKAEALARLGATGDDLREGYWLVNALYQRANPKVSLNGDIPADDGKENMTSTRFDDNYYNLNGRIDLLTLVYQERQREFLGEYKRWFDLVRYAEAENDTEGALNLMGASRAIQTRLRSLNSFYNPVFEDEMKVNPNLVQNPAWNTGVNIN